jgi:flagellar protein FlaF
MTLAADCARPENALAPDLRAQIISLSMWVGRHTSAVVRQEEPVEPLIEINRIMMQGLSARGAGQNMAADR